MEVLLNVYDLDATSTSTLGHPDSAGNLEKHFLASCKIDRWYMDQTCKVERLNKQEHGILASLFLPPGDGPHPGYIIKILVNV